MHGQIEGRKKGRSQSKKVTSSRVLQTYTSQSNSTQEHHNLHLDFSISDDKDEFLRIFPWIFFEQLLGFPEGGRCVGESVVDVRIHFWKDGNAGFFTGRDRLGHTTDPLGVTDMSQDT